MSSLKPAVTFQERNINRNLWVLVYAVVLIWSGINPKDQFTWILEVAPALIGGTLLLVT